MSTSFASSFDALSGWRTAMARRLDELTHFLADHELAALPQAAEAV